MAHFLLTYFRTCQSSPRNDKKQHLPNDIQPDDMDLCHRRVCMYRIGLHLKLTLKIQNEYNFLSTPIHKLVKDTLCNDDLAEAASHH